MTFDFSSATDQELYILMSVAKSELAEVQEKIKNISHALEERYFEQANDALLQQGKDFGSVTLSRDGHDIKITKRKRREWDQDKLRAVLDKMSPEDARHYADVKLSVSEAKYNNAPPEIKAALSDCTTVHLTGVGVEITEAKDA
jgi:hypothetical protein